MRGSPAQSPKLRPAAFLDRDGVINLDTGYLHRAEDCVFVPGAAEAIARLNDNGYMVVVVTNQSGVARGYYSEDDVRALHSWMQERLEAQGARIDAFYHCPHHPEGSVEAYRQSCICRKPGPGMILTAMAEHPIRREGSILIGDRETDIEAAGAAGLPGFLFGGGDLDAFVSTLLGSLTPSDDMERSSSGSTA